MPTSTTAAALPNLWNTATVDEISSAIDEFGAVIVADLVDADLVHGSRTVRFNGLAANTSAFTDVCLDVTILGVVDRRLIPDGGSTPISSTHVTRVSRPPPPAECSRSSSRARRRRASR